MKNYIFTIFIALNCLASASEDERAPTALEIATVHSPGEAKTDLQILAEITAANEARQEALARATNSVLAGSEILAEKDKALTGGVKAAEKAAAALEEAKKQAEAKTAGLKESHENEKAYHKDFYRDKRCIEGCRDGCWGSISTCCCTDFCFEECLRKLKEKHDALMRHDNNEEKPKRKGCCPWDKMRR